jgi:predicted ATPase
MDLEKIGKTEALFREVNEAIARTAVSFDADEAEFVCECADRTCADRIPAELHEYERVRAHPARFILKPGHEKPRVEKVVRRMPGYAIVEKVEKTVARIARRLNPRPAAR